MATAAVRKAFVTNLAKQTGLEKQVIYAWTLAENTDTSVDRRPFNYLNLAIPKNQSTAHGYSGVQISKIDVTADGNYTPGFHTVGDGVKETAWWINNMPHFLIIKQAAGQSPDNQIKAISTSPWAAGGYHTLHIVYEYVLNHKPI